MIKEGSGMARSGNGPYKGWMKGMIGNGGQMECYWGDGEHGKTDQRIDNQ